MAKSKTTRGGARKGAGRKARHTGGSRQVSLWLPVALIDSLDLEAGKRECSRSQVAILLLRQVCPLE